MNHFGGGEEDDSSYYYEDDLLANVHIAYNNVFVAEASSNIKHIESDDTGKLLTVIEFDGTVSVWECDADDRWKRQAAWRFKDIDKPPRYRQPKNHEAMVTFLRPSVITRWCHGHGRYLAMASDNSKKVHLFAENDAPPLLDRSDPPIRWIRKHSLLSADNITEMRFSPTHVELTLVTATTSGMVVVHMLQDKNNITSWRPIHAISVFVGQRINSLSWNQNPVHELPILVASTNDVDAKDGKSIAVFAINSPSVRPETNMCFDVSNQVTCVAFAPSTGLNDSLLAVGVGRRICLYIMNVEEFQVPDQLSPSVPSEAEAECEHSEDTESESATTARSVNTNSPGMRDSGGAVPASSATTDQDSNNDQTTPTSINSYMNNSSATTPNPNQNVAASVGSDFSPLLPNDFFKLDENSMEDLNGDAQYKKDAEADRESQLGEDDSTDEEEEEREPMEGRKALMWNVKWIAAFRESCAVRQIQWGRNPDTFTAFLTDGRLQSYKWSFGCVWSRSASIHLRKIHSNHQENE